MHPPMPNDTLSHKPVAHLHLSHSLSSLLAENGYKTVADVADSSVQDLAVELRIPVAQAEDIHRRIAQLQDQVSRPIAGPSIPVPIHAQHVPPTSPIKASQIISSTASALLSTSLPAFSTLSSSIDGLLLNFSPVSSTPNDYSSKRKGKQREDSVGSLSPGMAVEISGPPGIGKTSLVIGLALSASSQKKQDFIVDDDGMQSAGEVLIVDTEGAITFDRLAKAAEALHRKDSSVTPPDHLKNIHLFRIPTQVQMIAFLNTIDDWLDENPKVHLVIIDSLSYHFRQPSLDMTARRRFMELTKQQVGKATSINRCAVVITSQLATKLLTNGNKPANFDTGDRAVLMPQLGDQWTTAKTIRIVLFRGGPGDEYRYAHASTNVGYKEVPWASYDIDTDGLPCDIPNDDG